MIDRKALATIHIRKDKLKLGEEAYRALLKSRYGVESAKDLDMEQYADLLGHMKTLEAADARGRSICRLICGSGPSPVLIPPGRVYREPSTARGNQEPCGKTSSGREATRRGCGGTSSCGRSRRPSRRARSSRVKGYGRASTVAGAAGPQRNKEKRMNADR